MYTSDSIHALRTSLGLTMKDFADLIGTTESTVSRWESGKSHPTFATQIKLNELATSKATSKKRAAAAV
jgi:DNA-binding transcriptional regulator YiaG